MALNLGVKPQKPATAGPAPSIEELFDAYMGFESVVRATDLFLQKGQQIEDAFENLCIVGSALKKHASAEGMATVKDIVRDELGVEVSVEAFKEKAKAAWEAIKAFFEKIGIWIKEFFSKIFNWAVNAGKRIDNAIKAIEALPDTAELKWSYKGTNFLGTQWDPKGIDERVKNLASFRKSDVDKKKGDISTIKKNDAQLQNDKVKTVDVDGKEKTLKVLKNAKYFIAFIPKYKQAIEAEYKQAKANVKKPAEGDNIADLKETQKRMRAAVSMVSKECAVYSRTIASIIIHVPKKSTAKAAQPATK